MFFQPPDEESHSQVTKPTQKNVRRRRKKKFANKNKRKAVTNTTKKTPSRFTFTMSSWAESFTHAATWQFKHQIAYWKSRAKALEYENRILHEIIRKNCVNQSNETPQMGNVASASECCSRTESDEETEEYEKNVGNDDNDEDFEVSEEFIQFLTANAKYKEDAKRERELLKAKQEEKEAASAEMEAGSEEKQLNSDETMKNLYGDNWQRIAALEISIQSQFLRDTDAAKPMYWPNIPFNFNFS